MDKWHVKMTFEGDLTAPSASHAIADFKSVLGLAPASLQSEVHLSEVTANRWDVMPDEVAVKVEVLP
jgi:hypothetical protein